ncbi:hypothetical protein HD806DRAFT_527890 [Xylariaceae sp. AK1471]|nr:hypothetical protein HD806DRAFT_527890 [Xylariaceae sp. AK1471]
MAGKETTEEELRAAMLEYLHAGNSISDMFREIAATFRSQDTTAVGKTKQSQATSAAEAKHNPEAKHSLETKHNPEAKQSPEAEHNPEAIPDDTTSEATSATMSEEE